MPVRCTHPSLRGADGIGRSLGTRNKMPSCSLNQFADLEEIMCKKLLSLDLREQSRLLPSLSLAMRTPGYIDQPCNDTLFPFSFSSVSTEPSDTAFLPSSQWGQPSESPLPSPFPNSAQWSKPGFSAQRSLSMVETSSAMAANLAWPGTEIKHSQSDSSPAPLNITSSLPSSSSSTSSLFSLFSSASSNSVSSSLSRYKTELCRSFAESGVCKYGGKCQFAHGLEELRDLNRHPKYKTEPCRTFHTIGFCPYGIRCHFVHNNEEEQFLSRSSSSSSQPPSRSRRPPPLRHSFSFAGFPSVSQQALRPTLPPPPRPQPASDVCAPPVSPPSCADVTDLLSHVFLEMNSAFEASPAHQYQPPMAQISGDAQPQFLPSPDSGCSLYTQSPTASPSLRSLSPSAAGGLVGPLGARSLSYNSLSDPDQDASSGSSVSSLSGSESCGGVTESNGRRLAVFSQLSVPEDATGFYL